MTHGESSGSRPECSCSSAATSPSLSLLSCCTEQLLSDTPIHLDVFPAHVALKMLGHAAVPGVLLGHRGHLLVRCLVLHERHKDHFVRLPVAIAGQLHDLSGDLWSDRLLPLLGQCLELRLPSGFETRVTDRAEHADSFADA